MSGSARRNPSGGERRDREEAVPTDRAQPPGARDKEILRPWLVRSLLAFVLGTLIALFAAPLAVQHRIDSLRDVRLEEIQPARDLVTDLHVAFAVQMSALRGFVLVEEEAFLLRYEEALEDQREVLSELSVRVAERTPEAAAYFERVQRLAQRWNDEVEGAGILELRAVPENYTEQIPAEHVIYEEVLEETASLRDELLRESERNRASIEEAERFGLVVTFVLIPLTLAAAGVLVWFGRTLWRLADAAERGRRVAEEEGEAKERMVRGLTHDLRNPLSVVDMSARRLERTSGESSEERVLAGRIRRSVVSLNKTMDDLLAAARRGGGAIALRREPVDAGAVARGVVEDNRPMAEAGGLDLQVQVASEVPEIESDPVRVREILRNLVLNAIKYTPEGGSVRVSVTRRPAGGGGSGRGWVAVEVADTGPGIPADKLKAIFEEFSRLDETREGLGVGLAISRRVAEILGGQLTAESEVGEGSKFTLWLPLEGRGLETRRGTAGKAR